MDNEAKIKITSPCTQKCHVYSHYCKSCGRTLNEICRWEFMDEEEKAKILSYLEQRKRYLPN